MLLLKHHNFKTGVFQTCRYFKNTEIKLLVEQFISIQFADVRLANQMKHLIKAN